MRRSDLDPHTPTAPLPQVMRLLQVIARARNTAQKMAQQSSQAACSRSFLSWFGGAPPDLSGTFGAAEPEESEECLKKTHELLERALENLCHTFKVRLRTSTFAWSHL